MRVVHIIEALGGGVYTYFKDLSNFFGDNAEQLDIETFIIYSAKRKEIDPGKIRNDFSDKLTLIELDMERELSPIKDLKATFKLRKILKEIKPDAIHLHSSKAGVIGRWASFLLIPRKKIFYTPHGYSFLRQDISKLKQSFYKLIEKNNQLLFGGITIACGDTEYEIAKTLGEATLVRNGVDFKLLETFYKPVENKRLKIGLMGRIVAPRNPKFLNEIAKKHPQYDFIWIGDGEDRELLTSNNIEITGWFLNNLDSLPLLNKIDVFLQTSLWEGLPIAVLEAMALRKPVVATNVIGNKDIVVNGVSGFLFETIQETTDLFKQLENKEFREKMGENAYMRCKQNFDKDKNFQQLAPLYRG